jgi:hypothetical protein
VTPFRGGGGGGGKVNKLGHVRAEIRIISKLQDVWKQGIGHNIFILPFFAFCSIFGSDKYSEENNVEMDLKEI